ncbi:MAG: enoyl-CoA hydratase/isomerase family protein [Gammaproteobacteria bacterium]|nr:enoyl-CoA hydratase/isomerase family protein [Gammaproteobacteria bacterium]
MHLETLIYEKSNGVAEIRFNRPHRLNAVTQTLYDELLRILDDVEQDSAIRVAVLTGEGRAFCVGADMKEHGSGNRTPFQRRQYLRGEQDVCRRIFSLTKPVIAAVNGYALGAGAELAIVSDFLLMADNAQIGLPEISIGTFLGGGVTHLLPQLIGLAKARELIFLGDRLDGTQAQAIGLATRVFPATTFMADTRNFAMRLASKAPLSMAMAKRQLNHGIHSGMESALTAELEGMTFCATTKDWQEGVDAFAEKRQPVFKGE